MNKTFYLLWMYSKKWQYVFNIIPIKSQAWVQVKSDSRSIILRYSKSSQHSHSHCMHSNRNPYKCSNWNLAKIFIQFHGLKGVLNSMFSKARHQSQSPTYQWFSESNKMVLIKEVVVIILFFILWIYSIFLFYRWYQVSCLSA